jgi:hypothetical protein
MSKSVLSVVLVASTLYIKGLSGEDSGFLSQFSHIATVASTVPGNGDVNPYGVAVVPVTTGNLVKDDILVSNFNDASNLQGTGTTIVQIGAGGAFSVFASLTGPPLPGACPGGVGLTTALVALSSGWVIVGSLPTSDGMADTAQAGCLIVLNSKGQAVETISGAHINGPWDMTAVDSGSTATLFVSNVLNGTVAAAGGVVNQGSVVRIGLNLTGAMPAETSRTVIASSFGERTDPAALVIGPTGLGLSAGGVLYVADTLANRIAAIANAMSRTSDAGNGTTVRAGGALKQPLGLAIAPNGDIITVNGGDGHMVEVTPGGDQLSARFVDVSHSKNGGGTLFGLAVAPAGGGVYFVDDGNNTLNLLH